MNIKYVCLSYRLLLRKEMTRKFRHCLKNFQRRKHLTPLKKRKSRNCWFRMKWRWKKSRALQSAKKSLRTTAKYYWQVHLSCWKKKVRSTILKNYKTIAFLLILIAAEKINYQFDKLLKRNIAWYLSWIQLKPKLKVSNTLTYRDKKSTDIYGLYPISAKNISGWYILQI